MDPEHREFFFKEEFYILIEFGNGKDLDVGRTIQKNLP
jgi:hypothetical protein